MKPAVRKKKKGRASGGQIVGVRKALTKKVVIKEWKEGIVIEGLKLGVEECEWVIVTVYNNRGFKKLEKELEHIVAVAEENRQSICVIGDMNARIGREQGKTGDDLWGPGERESKDMLLNAEGKRMIDWCDRLGLVVMNGKCEGDREGNITFVGDNEGSVIDYVIISEGKEHIIEEMKVEVRIESDHLPIVLVLDHNVHRQSDQREETQREQSNQERALVWKQEKREQYAKEFEKRWAEADKELEGKRRWEILIAIIKETADKVGMTRKKNNDRTTGPKKTDEGTRKQRKVVWGKLKEFLKAKNQRNEVEKKQQLVEERNKLKKMTKDNNRKYWESKWNKVEKCENIAGIWEVIKPFKAKRLNLGKQVEKPEWVNHFKELLGGDEELISRENGEREQAVQDVDEDDLESLNRDIGGRRK